MPPPNRGGGPGGLGPGPGPGLGPGTGRGGGGRGGHHPGGPGGRTGGGGGGAGGGSGGGGGGGQRGGWGHPGGYVRKDYVRIIGGADGIESRPGAPEGGQSCVIFPQHDNPAYLGAGTEEGRGRSGWIFGCPRFGFNWDGAGNETRLTPPPHTSSYCYAFRESSIASPSPPSSARPSKN